jgi:guanylate kinase
MHNLLAALPNTKPLLSYTTRAPRPSDEPGEYEYVTQEKFDEMSKAHEFLWEAHAYVNHYGTRKVDIDQALTDYTHIYMPVLVIDVIKQLHDYAKAMHKSGSLYSMYIKIEDENELRSRFKERGDKPEEVEARIAECKDWNEKAKTSGVPFIFLEAQESREKIVEDAMGHLKKLGVI